MYPDRTAPGPNPRTHTDARKSGARGWCGTLYALNGAPMSAMAEQFRINLNQNLWGLLVGLGALGTAEYLNLCTLFWFAAVVSGIMVLSVAITTLAYTINYWRHKQD